MLVFSLAFWLGAAAGGAVIWFGKDFILKTVLGAETFAAKLRTKSDALVAAVKKV